jgi:hypothetical protein
VHKCRLQSERIRSPNTTPWRHSTQLGGNCAKTPLGIGIFWYTWHMELCKFPNPYVGIDWTTLISAQHSTGIRFGGYCSPLGTHWYSTLYISYGDFDATQMLLPGVANVGISLTSSICHISCMASCHTILSHRSFNLRSLHMVMSG